MVDPVNPVSAGQQVLSVGKEQKFEDQKQASQAPSSTEVVDSVEISSEAQALSSAQKAATSIANDLATNKTTTLSSDTERLNALA